MAPGIPPVRIAFYQNHTQPRPLSVEDYDWEEAIEFFSEHTFTDCAPCPGGQACKKKFGEAISPGAPRAGTSRLDENVDFVSLLIYDFDHLSWAELHGISDRLEGLEAVLYSTHSHLSRGPDDVCVRIVLPLARALKPHEFRWVHRRAIERYQLEWFRSGVPVKTGADPSRKDLSGLYFLPTAPVGTEVLFSYEKGALLDLDELLNDCPEPGRLHVVPGAFLVDLPLPVSTVDMDSLRELLKNYKPSHPEKDEGLTISRKELVRRVFHQEALTRPEEGSVRRKSCHRIAKILAYHLPITTPVEAVVELVRPSVSKMPTFESDDAKDSLEERFLKVSDSWGEGIAERAVQDAKFEAERATDRARVQKLRDRLKLGSRRQEHAQDQQQSVQSEQGGPDELPSTASEPLTEGQVTDVLQCRVEQLNDALHYRIIKKVPVLMEFLANVVLILGLHPEWEGQLRYNEITKNIDVLGGPLEKYESTPAQLTTGTKLWLQSRYAANFNTTDVFDALVHIAKSNAYNPLRDYLNGTRADGVARIDTFLESYCGVSLVDVEGKDISEYVRKVSRRWLLSAVARAFTPGCKMDTVLILEGKTGIYKSTALKALGGPFFSDSKISIGGNDAMQLAGTNWIHEIAELTAFHASETEQQKAFFSSPVDQFRAPYDRVPFAHPRLACFVGSTNDDRYMNDATGNRRYWPVTCEKTFRIRELRRDRDKIWAEAVAVFKTGLTCLKCQSLNVWLPQPWYEQYAHERCEEHRWWFNNDENEMLETVNVHRLRADYADTIREYILRLSAENRREAYTLTEFAIDMLKLAPDRVQSQTSAIGRALKVLGFEKSRVIENGIQVRVFRLPELLMKAPKKPPAHMKLVKAEAAK